MTGIHCDTIMRLMVMVRVGEGCKRILDERMRDLDCQQLQVDEIWCYVVKKQRRFRITDNIERTGDQWTFVALDRDTKLVPSYLIGKRTLANATAFLTDLESRLRNRVQLSSDGLKAYVEATEGAFGAGVDYAQIVKTYEAEPIGPGRYSRPRW